MPLPSGGGGLLGDGLPLGGRQLRGPGLAPLARPQLAHGNGGLIPCIGLRRVGLVQRLAVQLLPDDLLQGLPGDLGHVSTGLLFWMLAHASIIAGRAGRWLGGG